MFGPKVLRTKIISKKMSVQKIFLVQKNSKVQKTFGSHKILGPKKFEIKHVSGPKIWVEKYFCSRKILFMSQQILGSEIIQFQIKKIVSKSFWVEQTSRTQIFLGNQNWVYQNFWSKGMMGPERRFKKF